MFKRVRLPGHGTVIAYLALFAALGGSAYALSRGEVKTKHIANGAVTSSKIAPRAALKRCDPGSVAAAATWYAPSLPTDGTFVEPDRFGGEEGFACRGSGLEATKLATGSYRVRYNGLQSPGTNDRGLIEFANAEPNTTNGALIASATGPYSGGIFQLAVKNDAGVLTDPGYISLQLVATRRR